MELKKKSSKRNSLILKIKPIIDTEFFVKNIEESFNENRIFYGIIKEIIEFNANTIRILLMDSVGDLIYCLLLDI